MTTQSIPTSPDTSAPPRHDLYGVIHKGLRARMFDTSALIARTDFTDDAQVIAAAAAVAALLELLDEHSHHEDTHVIPEVRAVAPEVAAALDVDHDALDGKQRELRALLAAVTAAAGPERWALGRRLHLRLCLLVSDHLRHMDREETLANAALWAARTDAELMAVSGRISASISVPRLVQWWSFVLPAIDGKAREAILGGMRQVAPEVHAALTA